MCLCILSNFKLQGSNENSQVQNYQYNGAREADKG